MKLNAKTPAEHLNNECWCVARRISNLSTQSNACRLHSIAIDSFQASNTQWIISLVWHCLLLNAFLLSASWTDGFWLEYELMWEIRTDLIEISKYVPSHCSGNRKECIDSISDRFYQAYLACNMNSILWSLVTGNQRWDRHRVSKKRFSSLWKQNSAVTSIE